MGLGVSRGIPLSEQHPLQTLWEQALRVMVNAIAHTADEK